MRAKGRRETERDRQTWMQTETGESDGCGRTDGQRRERPGGRDGGVLRERGGPGALIGCGQRRAGPGGMGCRGGLGVGPCAAPPGPTLPPRCAGASRTLAGLLGSTWEGSLGEGPGPRGLRPGLPPLLSARPGLPGPGEGGRFWPVPPPHAPPRGPDSGVRGRTGDARPVYPPGAASAPTGGATRAGEGSPPRPATCPGLSALGRKTPSPPRWYPRVQAPSTLGLTSPGLQCLVPQTHQSRLSPPPSLPQGVCCLVLVALSLWPDIAAAPGPPPGPPRASADPRAELDSAVLLSRSLLADTRQLAAQLVGETGGDGREPGPGVTEWVSGLPPWQRGGGRNLRLVVGRACGPRRTEQHPPHKPLSPRETNSQPTGTTTWIPCPPWP